MGQRYFPFVLAAGVVALDRITKLIIKSNIGIWDRPIRVIPGFFNIVHTENPGIAFGLFADSVSPWRNVLLIGFSIGVLALISIALIRGDQGGVQSRVMRSGLGLVLGGACGNLYDRLLHGTVTDFIEVHANQYYFPSFNVADSAITIGACLLLLDMWLSRERKTQTADAHR